MTYTLAFFAALTVAFNLQVPVCPLVLLPFLPPKEEYVIYYED